jgi:hypothetical protein
MKLERKRIRTSQGRLSKNVLRTLFRVGGLALTMSTLMAVGIHLSLADFTVQRSLEDGQRAGKRVSQNATQQGRTARFDLDDPRQAWREGEALRLDEIAEQQATASSVVQKRRRSKTVTTMSLTTLVVTNTNDSGAGSLRQAITTANSDSGPDQIIFNIPVSDSGFVASTFTIKLLTPLPLITSGDTVIDGTTQTAFTGDTNLSGPEVVIDGSVAVPSVPGLQVLSANNTISGLVINGFRSHGIRIFGPNAHNNAVNGCYIGTDPTGSLAVANSGNGVFISGGADTNRIGGTAAGSGNVISGNGAHGIQVAGSSSGSQGNNTIQGNRIGTNAAGTAAIENLFNGINIAGSSGNLVGGTDPGAGNVCSGNVQNGVHVVGRVNFTETELTATILSVGNTVQGNLCGTNATGTAAIPNGIDGVRLNAGATFNIIGGTTAAARNVFSSNIAHGVHFDASQPVAVDDNGDPLPFTIPLQPVSQNEVQGNFIGTDITGVLPLGNTLPGVILFIGPTDNLIGGGGQGQGNVIAFNTGGSLDDGNGGMIFIPGDGVNVAYDPNNPDDPNPTVRNRISGNSIHSNQGLGIDLSLLGTGPDAADGPTPNDPCDADAGPNNFQNAPVLTSVQTSGGNTIIQGTLNSTPNTTFRIEGFLNDDCDPSGFGEGQIFIGSLTVTTDNNCNASFTATLPGTIGCRSLTATATDPVGNTSEFSNCINEAPVANCSVATNQLWPPNHDLINVGLSATATDNCPGTVVSVQVFSDEDDEAPTGEGNFSPDAKNIASGTLRLRAERDANLDGRVYLIIVTATDSSGNVRHCCSTVTVAKSQSAASKQSVANQAAAARAFCEDHGTAPPGYFLVGDGPIVGPKQ